MPDACLLATACRMPAYGAPWRQQSVPCRTVRIRLDGNTEHLNVLGQKSHLVLLNEFLQPGDHHRYPGRMHSCPGSQVRADVLEEGMLRYAPAHKKPTMSMSLRHALGCGGEMLLA